MNDAITRVLLELEQFRESSRPMLKSIVAPLVLVVASVASVQVLQKHGAAPAAPKAAAKPVVPEDIRGMMVLPEDGRGHFLAQTRVNGVQIDTMVDTGASVIALTLEDAARIGIFPNASDYRVGLSTANGSVAAAPVRLREVRLGGILVNDVEAVVLPSGRLRLSLLGMSFLRRLSSFQVANGSLLLKE
jgi:aspartyl protease family protein